MVETLVRIEEKQRQELWFELPLFAECEEFSFEKTLLHDDGLYMTIDISRGEEFVGVFEFFFAGMRILATYFPIAVPQIVEVEKEKVFSCFKDYIRNTTKNIEVIS